MKYRDFEDEVVQLPPAGDEAGAVAVKSGEDEE